MTSAFGETLRSITSTKLKEISKQQTNFENNRATAISAVNGVDNPHQRLRSIINCTKKSFGITDSPHKRKHWSSPSADIEEVNHLVRNIERFQKQAQHDPTISHALFQEWESTLMQKLDTRSLKLQYASLYGELVNDWLSRDSGTQDGNAMDVDSFEIVDKAEQQVSRKQWEKAVFTPLETNATMIKSYLDALFGKANSVKALVALRKTVEKFEAALSAPNQFTQDTLKWTINGLLNSGLLSEEKNQVLRDFLRNPIMLDEVADVLNMRIMSLDDWKWEQEYVPVEQRRHLNGNYHVYIDEDLIEAIFLQYLGIRWSVFFKRVFKSFSGNAEAWATGQQIISAEELHHRKQFFGPDNGGLSLNDKRRIIHRSNFFAFRLPDSYNEERGDAAGAEEADYDERKLKRAKMPVQQPPMMMQQAQSNANPAVANYHNPPQQNQMAMQQQQHYQQQLMMLEQQNKKRLMMARQEPPMAFALGSRPDSDVLQDFDFDSFLHQDNDPAFNFNHADFDFGEELNMTPMEAKQYLLHLLSTEIQIGTKLCGEFSAIHASFELWSSTLPHSTIKAVLAFLGLSPKWLSFFTTFLEAPLRFTTDGPNATTQHRKRGVPGAHSLSLICGEAILFVLDYTVNQKTDGALLYRMHDDFWLWSPSHDTVVSAWEAITSFSKVMGVTINEGKTGSVRISSNEEESAPLHPKLPVGKIRWGFLTLNADTGRFDIDQDMVDKHIKDLQAQLKDKKSVFSYIQAWNTYAGTFFLSNFATPCNAFGQAHVDNILSTLRRVQLAVFGEDSNIASHVKDMVSSRFNVTDILDGYLYFPTSLGGLELQNPFIGMIQMRDSVSSDPSTLLTTYFESEKEAYSKAKKAWESGETFRKNYPDPYNVPQHMPPKTFMTFAEFVKYREDLPQSFSGNLINTYEELLRKPSVRGVSLDGKDEIMRLVKGCGELDTQYLKWVGMLYGKEMVSRFGGLRVVDKGLLPTGMVNLFRSGRVKWQ